ncbi:MAG: DNA recombination protein RmuC [Elusimicrobia bacterium]|nr:DNA recombination protein RmuC [Elusimicrobiota bacterium]
MNYLIVFLSGVLTGGAVVWLFWQYRFKVEKGVPHQDLIDKYVLKTEAEKRYEEIKKQFEHYKIEFENLAQKVLEDKSEKFLSLSKRNLESILNPLKEKIDDFKKRVDDTHSQEMKELGALFKLSTKLSEDANNLASALKGDNKLVGNWGEFQLETILQKAGLIENINYKKQPSFEDRDGAEKRPDYVVMLPDNKNIVIDSKVSLVAYEKYFNADSSEKKEVFLKEHVKSIQDHIKNLTSKNYQSLYQINQPDYVVLFMPLEPALSMALQKEPKLFETAIENNIVIVSATTLLATLRTVAYIWKQENQKRNVLEIARQAGAMYDKFVDFVSDLEKVGQKIDDANDSYHDAMNKLKDSKKRGDTLIGRAEKIKELGANTSKSLPPEI